MATYYSKYSPWIDWSEIGQSDPVPGDAEQIRAMAKDLRTTATALQTAKDKLEQIKNDQSADSDAVTEFKSMSGDTGDSIYRAHGRYTTVAAALESYASDLEGVQARAVTALNTALQTKEDKARAESTRDGITADQDEDGSQFAAAERNVTSLAWQESDDRRALESIHNDWISAGNRAASAIDGSFDDGLTPDPWEKFWQMASEILDTLSTVLSIAALVLAWVPFLGQALAALALVVAALNLITKLVLAIGYGGDWGDVGWALAGLAGGALAKGASGVLKGGAAALRGTRLAAPASRAATGASRAGTALRSGRTGLRAAPPSAASAASEYAYAMRNPFKAMALGVKDTFTDFAAIAGKVKADGYLRTTLKELDGGRGLLPGVVQDSMNLKAIFKDPNALASFINNSTRGSRAFTVVNSLGQIWLWSHDTKGLSDDVPLLSGAPTQIAESWDTWQDAMKEESYNRG